MGPTEEDDAGREPSPGLVWVRRAYAAAILAADERKAQRTIREALRRGWSWSQIDDHVIAPSLWFVGELWQQGEITVADEHIATEITIRVLTLQREAERVARDRREYRVMLGTPAGERHDVALRMAANLLDDARYETIMLGSDIPAGELATCAARLEADIICLSVTLHEAATELVRAIDEIHQHAPHAAYLIGGSGLDLLVSSRTDVTICPTVSGAVDAVDALIKRASLN